MRRVGRILLLVLGLGALYGAYVLDSSDRAARGEVTVEGQVIYRGFAVTRDRGFSFNQDAYAIEFNNPVTGTVDTAELSKFAGEPTVGAPNFVFVDEAGNARGAYPPDGPLVWGLVIWGAFLIVGAVFGSPRLNRSNREPWWGRLLEGLSEVEWW